MLWSECFLLCMHLVRISVLWFKHVRLSASRINSFSVMQVSQNLAPGKYIPVFALTFHCISGWIFLSFRLQTCFESLVGFLSAVFLFRRALRCSVYRFLNVLPVIPMYCMVLFGSITSAWYTNGPTPQLPSNGHGYFLNNDYDDLWSWCKGRHEKNGNPD